MKVKIKTWEKMEKEFGLDEDGHINCNAIFVPSIEGLMPLNRIIEIDYYGESMCFDGWDISDDMIEEYL